MKILFLGDLHIGLKNDSEHFRQVQKKFFSELLEIITEQKIDIVFQLGDMLDKRTGISFITAEFLLSFLNKLERSGIKFYSLLGNHDVVYKNTNSLAGITHYKGLYKNIEFIEHPKTFNFDEIEIRCIPWINPENECEAIELIKKEKTTEKLFICGHFELSGFEYYNSNISLGLFTHADKVISGHYHAYSKKSNFEYIGVPYKLTWKDYNDKNRIMIYDTENKEFSYIFNDYSIFNIVRYENGKASYDKNQANCYTRVYTDALDEKFELFVSDYIDKWAPITCDIIPTESSNELEIDLDNIQVNSPLNLILSIVDNMSEIDKEFIKQEIINLYEESTKQEQ